MGFFKSFTTGQFIDVIQWTDDSKNTMVYRFEMDGKEIMMGAQLTVRESQVAVFVNEGQIADVFSPGRYELSTQNMPFLTKLKSWSFGFNSPFKSEVYFVNTKQFLDCKWGTANPIMMRDADFGIIRVRAFGSYAFRVVNPTVFMREVFGTASLFTVAGAEGQIKSILVSGLTDAIAQSKIPALDLAANYTELSELAISELTPKIEKYGLAISELIIENISLPEEVEKAMDRRTSMGVVGNLGQYTQYQAAEAMREAANNPNGSNMAGMGVGMGAGAMMGQMFSQNMYQNMQPQAPVQSQPQTYQQASGGAKHCVECGHALAPNAKFCPECGAKQQIKSICSGCGKELAPNAKFCGNCGQKNS